MSSRLTLQYVMLLPLPPARRCRVRLRAPGGQHTTVDCSA
ncbi:hypothetical protein STXM2123_726 [Streptomyces sp. F-3]|nr:hypothetical protein STXM2123_726 [Streptomyces sp. F-3]